MNYTKGPWKAEICTLKEAQEDGEFEWTEKDWRPFGWDDNTLVGSVWLDTGDGTTGLPGNIETSAENARLIAAAPELLEALEDAVEFANNVYGPNKGLADEQTATWRAAIAKAKNEQ